MERAAFLIEHTGERISCLLNPETVVLRRVAGVQPRQSVSGALTGSGLTDDPLLYTGGGQTELELDLLFDVHLGGSWRRTNDVRQLTRPLWELAENRTALNGVRQLPLARFVWGKSWNIPGVVVAVAERVEHFTPGGAPQRSWLRLRLLRVSEPPAPQYPSLLSSAMLGLLDTLGSIDFPDERVSFHEVLGAAASGGEWISERLDEMAASFYGQPQFWRVIAAFNSIDNPLRLLPGVRLRIPPLSFSVEASIKVRAEW